MVLFRKLNFIYLLFIRHSMSNVLPSKAGLFVEIMTKKLYVLEGIF